MFFSDTGMVLRKGESGERFLVCFLFLKERGLKPVLLRKSQRTGKGPGPLDLFDICEFKLQQKDGSSPAFLQDFAHGKRFSRLSRDYRSLEAASLLCRFYELNLLHMESFEEAWDLLTAAISTLEEKPSPEVTLLKTLFRFARSEGYAVGKDWLEKLPPGYTAQIRQLLQLPVGMVPAETEAVNLWIQDLFRYFEQHTDLLPPSPAA